MNKAELIDAIQVKRPEMSKATIRDAVDAFMDVVRETTTQGEKVVIVGFATFDIKKRVARTGRNPKTGESLHIPAHEFVDCALSKTWSKWDV